MANTPNLGITLIEQSQAQKEVTANQAFYHIDALLNNPVLDKDLTAPPGSSSAGDLYIVAAGATGDWAGQDGNLAAYINGSWVFIIPNEGMAIWVSDENMRYSYDGSVWQNAAAMEGLRAQGQRALWLPAELWRVSGYASAMAVATHRLNGSNDDDGSALITTALECTNSGAKEYACYWWKPPASWDDGNLSYRIYWSAPASPASGTDVVFGIQSVALNHATDWGAASWGSAVEVSDTYSAVDNLYVSSVSSNITISGASNDSLIGLQLYRDSGNISDDLVGSVDILGVELFFNINASTD